MAKQVLYILLLLISYSYAQKPEKSELIGTWELIEEISDKPKINIGQLEINETEEERRKTDSIQKVIEKRKLEDPRITKWHYVIEKKYLYEYRFEYGSKFRSKIINNSIYKFDKPFYEIISLNKDTLKLKEYSSKIVRVLKKVDVNLDDFEILSEQ
ncbi:hypothetical protein [Aquimarina latercula]|uniref:hypothetical protein n=1 Tax=Aquimarina latercula TaxID=987 RepID=UPI00040864E2|nr:hypothetical protein [Aquimarina latercula]